MNILKEYRLKDIVEGIYDGPHATPAKAEEGGIFLGIKNITEEGRIDLKDPYLISEKDLSKWTRRITPKYGDLVFSYEATLHRYALIPKEFYGCLGRRMALIRPKREVLDVKFLFYLFLSPSWRSFIEANQVSGSTVDRISLVKFPSYRIQLPPLPTQQRIASILSAYDDLIEVNNQRIQLLEETARELYKEWFVRMRFPGWKETKFVKGVPEGWEVKPISTICTQITDGTHDTPKPLESGVPLITGKHIIDGFVDFTSAYFISEQDHINISKRSGLGKGDIIISNIGTIGSASIVDYDVDFSVKNVVIFKPLVIEFSAFIYYYLTSSSTTEQFLSEASGTSQKFLSLGYFRNLKNVIPCVDLILKFNKIVGPMIKQKYTLQLQNTQLRQIRDRLLPRLISGKLQVKEA